LGFGVSGSAFRVSGFGFRVPGSGFQISGVHTVWGAGCSVLGSVFRFPGFRFRVSGAEPVLGSGLNGSGFGVQVHLHHHATSGKPSGFVVHGTVHRFGFEVESVGCTYNEMRRHAMPGEG